LHALLEGFFRDPPQFRRHGLFDVVHVFKTGPLDDLLELGEEEKITRIQVGGVGRLLQHGDALLGQELSDAQGIVSRRVVMVKQPRVVLPQLSPPLMH